VPKFLMDHRGGEKASRMERKGKIEIRREMKLQMRRVCCSSAGGGGGGGRGQRN
jgi:hypothetical protein